MRPVELESLGDNRTEPHWAGVVVGVALMFAAFLIATRLHDERTFAAGILVWPAYSRCAGRWAPCWWRSAVGSRR